jgi:hypothetical protein
MRLIAVITFATAALALANPAEARHYRHHHYHHTAHHGRVHITATTNACEYTNEGHVICRGTVPQNSERTTRVTETTRERYYANAETASDVRFIPNPPGTWRVVASCAHRLAAFWNLGTGLDKVSTWPHTFARTSGPGVGVAAVRHDQHHVIGIIGGGPGAWRVADFNSGGHLNREYTVASFPGYFFLDTRSRLASR